MSVIHVLSQDVVDKIAAGEVIQRPCNALKELIENSFDANANEVHVLVELNNQQNQMNLTVVDNGCGIHKDDLRLACQRHATSKLQTELDLSNLSSFGFRGEALSSISLVSRQLTITSRQPSSQVAYRQLYRNGKPTSSQPTPCARQIGTSIQIENVLENLRQRQKSMNLSTEYNRILQVLQHYAIHKSGSGISLICEKKTIRASGGGGSKRGGNKGRSSGSSSYNNSSGKLDLNTRQHCPAVAAVRHSLRPRKSGGGGDGDDGTPPDNADATKQAIVHVFGTKLSSHLHQFASSSSDGESDRTGGTGGVTYSCSGFVSLGSYQNSGKSTCIFFFNDRLVDCPPLKRALEELYLAEFGSTTQPWCYLSVQVPPGKIDVNVHPAKQIVTIMHVNEICQHLTSTLRDEFANLGQVFTSNGTSINKKKAIVGEVPTTKAMTMKPPNENSEKNRRQQQSQKTTDENQTSSTTKTATVDLSSTAVAESNGTGAAKKPLKNPYHPNGNNSKRKKIPSDQQLPNKKKKSGAVPASQLVRTHNATQVGALMPFLVPKTQSQSQQQIQTQVTTTPSSSGSLTQQSQLLSASATQQEDAPSAVETILSSQQPHDTDCPLSLQSQQSKSASLDLTQPGAFAMAASRCTCRSQIRVPRQAVVRPRKVVTECKYKSIKQLRKRVDKHCSSELRSKLRTAYFVGVVSQCRSLIQCGQQLCLLNHVECARHLFYQLALSRFAQGTNKAEFRAPVDIVQVIGQTLQLEEVLTHHSGCQESDGNDNGSQVLQDDQTNQIFQSGEPLPVSETNQQLAEQAAECLVQKSDMLKEYFSIEIKKSDDDDHAHLLGLPVLLDGYAPPSHALSLFLLRLATEVDYEEERPCFHGVCRELGAFYASMPNDEQEWLPHVRHVLFPALSTLLVPSKELESDGSSFLSLAQLNRLYQVFERC